MLFAWIEADGSGRCGRSRLLLVGGAVLQIALRVRPYVRTSVRVSAPRGDLPGRPWTDADLRFGRPRAAEILYKRNDLGMLSSVHPTSPESFINVTFWGHDFRVGAEQVHGENPFGLSLQSLKR